jgi:hypothetical protein
MKSFFEYDLNSPEERKERFEHYPELSKFDIALSEELAHDEYEKFFEAEKQSYFSINPNTSSSNSSTQKKSSPQLKWIH